MSAARIASVARRVLRIAAWIGAGLAALIAVNLIGLYLFGSIEAWNSWLDAHRWWLFGWRLSLYAATICGWWWMRERVRRRDPARDTRTRLRRAEIATVLAILATETSVLLRSP